MKKRIPFSRIKAGKRNLYAYDLYGYLLYRSRDAGKTWQDLRFRLPKGIVVTLAIDPNNPEHLILEMARGNLYNSRFRRGEFYSTDDGGDSWRFLFRMKRAGDHTDLIAFDPMHPGTVLFSAKLQILKSTEGGLHPKQLLWQDSRGINGIVKQIFFDPRKPDTVFFVNHTLYQSNNGGKTVYFSGQGLPSLAEGSGGDSAAFIASTENGEYLVENDDAQVLRSTNGGTRWHLFSQMNSHAHNQICGPFYAMDRQRTRFIAVCKGRLFESNEAGRHWKRINSEIPGRRYNRYVTDISDPLLSRLYVTMYTGIWKAVEWKH